MDALGSFLSKLKAPGEPRKGAGVKEEVKRGGAITQEGVFQVKEATGQVKTERPIEEKPKRVSKFLQEFHQGAE